MTGSRIALLLAPIALAACSNDTELSEETDTGGVWQMAKTRGVTFRAVGQEPGWLLEITAGDRILLETDYGTNRVNLPYVQPLDPEGGHRTRYALDGDNTVIEIVREHCVDTMSGEEFEAQVTITLNDKELHGCGRALD